MSPLPTEKEITEKKNVFRRRWRQVLAEGFIRDSARNEALCRRIAAEAQFQTARRIALFTARAWEVDLQPLWRLRPDLCTFPRVIPGTRDMEMYRIGTWDELKAGYAGIPEPPSEASRRIADWGEGDLVLVPGIYFDRCGQRIGSGMGFYDRFLAARKCLLWGVCWSEQWVPEEEFPCLPHDVPMARVITDSAVHAIPPFPGRPKSGHAR